MTWGYSAIWDFIIKSWIMGLNMWKEGVQVLKCCRTNSISDKHMLVLLKCQCGEGSHRLSFVREPWEGLLSLLAPFSSFSSTCSPGVFSSPRGKPRRPGSCAPDSQVPGELRNPLLFLRDYCCWLSVALFLIPSISLAWRSFCSSRSQVGCLSSSETQTSQKPPFRLPNTTRKHCSCMLCAIMGAY